MKTENIQPEKSLGVPAIYDNSHALDEILKDVETQHEDEVKSLYEQLNIIRNERDEYKKQLEENNIFDYNSDEEVKPRVTPIVLDQLNPLKYDDVKIQKQTEDNTNGWTIENYNTVRKWQTDIEKTGFIYGELLSKNNKNMEIVLVLTLAISALITIMSSLAVTLGFLDQTNVVLAFDIATLLCSTSITIMAGLIKIYGWDESIKKLTRFVEKLDSTWFVFETELSIAAEHRTSADEFIRRADGQYMYLMQECPPISGNDYSEANKKYKERLFNDYMWSQKFKQKMESEIYDLNQKNNST